MTPKQVARGLGGSRWGDRAYFAVKAVSRPCPDAAPRRSPACACAPVRSHRYGSSGSARPWRCDRLYQPPKPLSPIDPTRAESAAKTPRRLTRQKVGACFSTSDGPMQLSGTGASCLGPLPASATFRAPLPSISSAPVATKMRSNGPSSRPSRLDRSLVRHVQPVVAARQPGDGDAPRRQRCVTGRPMPPEAPMINAFSMAGSDLAGAPLQDRGVKVRAQTAEIRALPTRDPRTAMPIVSAHDDAEPYSRCLYCRMKRPGTARLAPFCYS